jgi:putative ABC transport system ATP-binding protein
VVTGSRNGARAATEPPELVAAVEARSLDRFYRAGEEETLALQGVSLTVAPGELVVVVGPSGSGKSTLLSCMAGTDDPDGGAVLVEGHRISHRPESVRAGIRARRIGVVAQSGNLFDHLTVEANLAFVRGLAGDTAADTVHASPRDVLRTVGLHTRAGAYPGELSGGEAARAALAVALVNDPAVILADEPTGELDTAAEADLLGLLVAAASRGVAVVVASHSPAVAAVADRVVALYDGRVVA